MQNTNEILPLEMSTSTRDNSNTSVEQKSISSLSEATFGLFLPFAFNVKRHGNLTLTGFFDKRYPDYPFIVIGSDYPYFIFASIIFLGYTFVFYFFMWKKANFYVNIVCLSFALLHHIIYLIIFLKNPGLNLSKPRNENSDIAACEYCHSIILRDKKQKHCEICNACIIGYDHHCPWTSKCVGANNVKMFHCFLGLTLLQFLLPEKSDSK